MKPVEAVVPAFQEACRVGSTVQALRQLPHVERVWVVDDGSSDDTAAVAVQAGAQVLRLPRRHGKGWALRWGAAHTRAPWVLFADADLGESASHLGPLVQLALAGVADMLIGAPPRRPGRHGLGWTVGLARHGVARLTGRWFQAPLSGQRVLRRQVLETLDPTPAGWGIEVALTVSALRAGWRVVEVPVDIQHRVTGLDWRGFRHRGRQLWHVGWTLWHCWRLARESRYGRNLGPRSGAATLRAGEPPREGNR